QADPGPPGRCRRARREVGPAAAGRGAVARGAGGHGRLGGGGRRLAATSGGGPPGGEGPTGRASPRGRGDGPDAGRRQEAGGTLDGGAAHLDGGGVAPRRSQFAAAGGSTPAGAVGRPNRRRPRACPGE